MRACFIQPKPCARAKKTAALYRSAGHEVLWRHAVPERSADWPACDLIHVHNSPDHQAVQALALRPEGVPVIWDCHDPQSLLSWVYDGERSRRDARADAACEAAAYRLADARVIAAPGFAAYLRERYGEPAAGPTIVTLNYPSRSALQRLHARPASAPERHTGVAPERVPATGSGSAAPARTGAVYLGSRGPERDLACYPGAEPVRVLDGLDDEDVLVALSRFAVGVIPFAEHEIMRAALPNKLFEYRAAGLDVWAPAHCTAIQAWLLTEGAAPVPSFESQRPQYEALWSALGC